MRSIPVVLLVASLAASGCLGSDAASPQSSDLPTAAISSPPTSSPGTPAEPEDVPKYHPHNYWGDRAEVLLFNDFPIGLGASVDRETRYRQNTLIVGYREFDTRSDGDDSQVEDKADVVLQGTKALVVKISWNADPTQSQIPGLTFLYKPANTAEFTAIKDVKNGGEYTIPLSKGWADMAHQLHLSRWKFALEAYDARVEPLPIKAMVAKGEARVTVRALNGGETSIDPPHPFNFLDGPERGAGQVTQRIDSKVVNTTAGGILVVGDPISGWKVPAPDFIPWETTLLKVWLYYNYTGPATAVPHELGLSYTDASGPDAKYPAKASGSAGLSYFEIPVLGNEADDPYATQSDWTWGVVPLVNGARDPGGEFAGDVHIVLVAAGSSEAMDA